MKKINIGGKEYNIKMSFRNYILFEKIADKTFTNYNSMSDMLLLFYCSLLAHNDNFSITFDEFIDVIDETPNTLTDFCTFMSEENSKDAQLIKKKKREKV